MTKTGVAAGGSLGLIFFLFIVGMHSILPQNIDWLLVQDNQDTIQHFVGWEFFRYESWHFPLGLITNYGYPVPTSIVYTDSIPLLALFFKCLSPWLPANFQYFGLWFAICFCLQGVFAWALSSYMTNNHMIKGCITLFFLLSPIMLNRLIEHQALVAHWVILAAILLYIRHSHCKVGDGAPAYRNSFILWLVLNTLTVLIHAYLTLIVLAIWMAFIWKNVFINLQVSLYQAVKWIAINLIVMLIVAWLCGYFVIPLANIMNADGYSLNAMNLLAPFMPTTGSMIVPGNWSLFIPHFQPLYMEQGDEGFNYLGVGVLILCALSLYCIIRNPPTQKNIIPWLPLLCVCLVLSLYALSNTIYIGQHVLCSYVLPKYTDVFTTMFRASGRFFWPAYYFLMLAVFFILNRRINNHVLTPIMIIALLLQATDLSSKMIELRKRFSVTAITENVSFWKNITGSYSRIVFIPAITRPDRTIAHFSEYIHYAAKHNMSVNLGYFARQNYSDYFKANKTSSQEVLQGHLSKDTLYIILNPIIAHLVKSRLSPEDTVTSIGGQTVFYRVT